MPWKECDVMSLRRELVGLMLNEAANVSQLCQRFGISRKTGYKWLGRYRDVGLEGLMDLSRRPHRFRGPTEPEMEQAVLAVRQKHPAWGGRKIASRLILDGRQGVPAASTITGILHRHRLIDPRESAKRKELIRFERSAPNELWQMDYKGEFKLGDGRWCHPLTVLDDYSRFCLCLRGCGDHKAKTVQAQLIRVFRLYGLPWEMLMDHGVPWYTAHSLGGWTKLSVWLLRLDIAVTHGRVCHPQTQGKDERFHRTFKAELKPGPWMGDMPQAQQCFDPWRESYNHERPHESVDMNVPASRYQPSRRAYPEQLPEVEYGPQDEVRSVNPVGQFHFHGRTCKTSEAFRGQRIGLRPTIWDGLWEVYFSRHRLGWLDLRGKRRGVGACMSCSRPEGLGAPESDAADDAAG